MEQIKPKQNIEPIFFDKALSERYLSYALSTIMSRSLPDVRDGLKPVHRRILYAMLQLNLNPDSGYKKCARIVGDVIGKYHPHGDVAVYDTLVRLAQDFSLRYPLIDGQGNFGSIDGDSAAAMRYTESRMTELCSLLMLDIDKDTVDFRANYDESDIEPSLMPSAFPNLLANGSEGIAVGMATSIPPHNLHELCDALLYMIENEDAKVEDIMQFVKGPDFPTGGVIIDNRDYIQKIYETGRGSFKVRAKIEEEQEQKLDEVKYRASETKIYKLIISEIPYQVQKSKILQQISEILKNKTIPVIVNARDESDEKIRIVIEVLNSAPKEIVVQSLFKHTDLESKVQLNLNVIGSNNVPRVMNLEEVLREFLNHRQNIVTRRSKFLLNTINKRLEVLGGLKIAYINLDEIIRIIREEDDAKKVFFDKFGLSDVQIDAIMSIRLRALRKLDEYEIIKESETLEVERAKLSKVLSNKHEMYKVIKNEIKQVQKKFSIETALGKRRTLFEKASEVQIPDMEELGERIPLTVLCSKMGWIRAIKDHNNNLDAVKYKDGDGERFVMELYSNDKLIIVSKDGRAFTLRVSDIYQGKGFGDSLSIILDMHGNDAVNILKYEKDAKYLLASTSGKGFFTDASNLLASTKLGKNIISIGLNAGIKLQNSDQNPEACIVFCKVTGDMIATIGENRKMLIFSASQMPVLKKGAGVIMQKLKDAKLVDAISFDSKDGLRMLRHGKVTKETQIMNWKGKRGSSGKIAPVGLPKSSKIFA